MRSVGKRFIFVPRPFKDTARFSLKQSGAKLFTIMISTAVLFATLFSGCSSSDISKDISAVILEHRSDDVSRYLIEKMSVNQVILLADNTHGQWQYQQTLIDLLETWFRTASSDSSATNTPRNLALVLESDSLHLAKALQYAISGNPEDALDVHVICGGGFTTASMEFFWRLGNLMKRIEIYNSTQKQSGRLNLTFIPGEITIDINHWSFEQRNQYFIHERDENIAKRIANFAELHPDCKIVAFYGSTHLQRGIVLKQADEESAQGLFLASYLDSSINGGIITVGQVTADYWGKYRDLFVFNNKKYILSTKHSNSEMQQILAGPFSYDAVVVHSCRYLWGNPILQIPSMNTARTVITSMPDIMNTSNDFYKACWPPLLTYLTAISGNSPHRFHLMDSSALKQEYLMWDKWLKEANMSIVPEIESLSIWQRLIDSLELAPEPRALRFNEVIISILPDAPPLKGMIEIPSPSERAAELRVYLDIDPMSIKIDNLIGLLWVGDDLERQMAEEALRRMADTSFSSPAQWSDWNRHRNDHAD